MRGSIFRCKDVIMTGFGCHYELGFRKSKLDPWEWDPLFSGAGNWFRKNKNDQSQLKIHLPRPLTGRLILVLLKK